MNGETKCAHSCIEYYLVIKWNKLIIYVITWMNLRIIMLIEEASHKRPHIIWFHFYERYRKRNQWRPCKLVAAQGCVEVGDKPWMGTGVLIRVKKCPQNWSWWWLYISVNVLKHHWIVNLKQWLLRCVNYATQWS